MLDRVSCLMGVLLRSPYDHLLCVRDPSARSANSFPQQKAFGKWLFASCGSSPGTQTPCVLLGVREHLQKSVVTLHLNPSSVWKSVLQSGSLAHSDNLLSENSDKTEPLQDKGFYRNRTKRNDLLMHHHLLRTPLCHWRNFNQFANLVSRNYPCLQYLVHFWLDLLCLRNSHSKEIS